MADCRKDFDPNLVPRWIWPPFRICRQRLEDEIRFLHLAMRGLQVIRALPNYLEVVERENREMRAESGESRPHSRLEAAKQDAEWVTSETQTGFPLLHSHFVIGIWSALEVLCEDFALAWLRNVPEAWKTAEVAKLKVSVGRYQGLTEDHRPRFVVSELSRSLGADLRKGVGKLKCLLGVFSLAPRVGENVKRALHELCQVRNVLVHCGGIADQMLTEECPWLGLKIGERVQLSHPLCAWYYAGARTYAERVSNQAMLALGFPGCECPGADEIHGRPEPDGAEGGRT